MFRILVSTAAATSLFALAGCSDIHYPDQGRPDAAWTAEKEVHRLGRTGLDFENATVGEVLRVMQQKFACSIRVNPRAQALIQETDPRVTAKVGEIPENLAFAVVRAQLEANGLVLVDLKNVFGQPGFELDRSAVREAQSAKPVAAK